MLKEFRSIDVYWDKATRRIHKKIRSSSSDEKGRKLTVQIVNDGQIQDLTNVSLNLYWETQDGENRGLDPFEPLDAENGIYELYFRTGMLKHVGKLNAHLHLVDTTGAITSEPFTIVVFQGVDVDAMASDDELSALNKALIEVQNITQDEAERVSAETERATAEEERVSNENERKTAETIRVSNETNRVDAEDTRDTNETGRVNAESGRVNAEIGRVTAETARVTAEEEREQGYPLLDGRLTTVEQNLISSQEIVKVNQTKTGDGKNPYIFFNIPVPEGCTTYGCVVGVYSSGVFIPYYKSVYPDRVDFRIWQANSDAVPTNFEATVEAFFHKV